MKKIMINFKLSVKFLVTLITSREFAFIFVMCGVIAQVSHTYFLVESISSLEGWYKTFQATLIAIFISASLLYFVSIAPKQDPDGFEVDENVKRVLNAVTVFTIIEIIINLFYYTKHLLLDKNNQYHSEKLVDFIFGAMVSCLIPYTIKLYSSQIRAKEWINEFSDDEESKPITVSEVEEALNEKLGEFDTKFEEKLQIVDDKVSNGIDQIDNAYGKNQDKFMNQFTAKLENEGKKFMKNIEQQNNQQ